MSGPWAAAAALAVVVGLALAVARAVGGSADFEIRRRRGGAVEVRGRIPKSKVGAIRAFFGHDLGGTRPLAVRGSFEPGGSLRLRFRGLPSADQRQRARNFLVEHLR